MPIAICASCGLPVADAFHNFFRVCECVPISEQKKRDKIMGRKEHNKCERVEQTFKIMNVVKLRGKDAN